jgi:hypothetical protein
MIKAIRRINKTIPTIAFIALKRNSPLKEKKETQKLRKSLILVFFILSSIFQTIIPKKEINDP